QKPDGSFASVKSMTGHVLATLALCEAYGMTQDRVYVLQPAQNAINYIVSKQSLNGGWEETLGAGSNMAVFGWVVQALKVAAWCKDIDVPDATFTRANLFLEQLASGPRKAM